MTFLFKQKLQKGSTKDVHRPNQAAPSQRLERNVSKGPSNGRKLRCSPTASCYLFFCNLGYKKDQKSAWFVAFLWSVLGYKPLPIERIQFRCPSSDPFSCQKSKNAMYWDAWIISHVKLEAFSSWLCGWLTKEAFSKEIHGSAKSCSRRPTFRLGKRLVSEKALLDDGFGGSKA